jgi:polysaccharide biosynthesis transport protein
MADTNYVELRWIVAVVKRWWWLIGAMTLIGVVAAYFITSIMPPVYESSALLLVSPSKAATESQYNNLMAGTQLALTYSQMLTDRPVLETVISQLKIKTTTDALEKQITAEPVHNSQIIKLTVTDSKPDQAALIANTLAQAFAKRVQELSTQQYAAALKNVNDQMVDLDNKMKVAQDKIDFTRTQKLSKDIELANKQASLSAQLNDYRARQSSLQSLQLTAATATGKVYVVEPIQVQKTANSNTSTASVVVSVGQSSSVVSLPNDPLMLTYGQLIVKPSFLQGIINELGLKETSDQISAKLSYSVVAGTQLLSFKMEDADGTKAQAILRSVVDNFVLQLKAMLVAPYTDQLKNLQSQVDDLKSQSDSLQNDIGKLTSESAQFSSILDQAQSDLTSMRSDYRSVQQQYEQIVTTASQTANSVVITEPAQAPKLPSQNRYLYLALGGILGMVIGSGVAFLLKFMDGLIRTDQDVRSLLKQPVFSTIGLFNSKNKDLVMWAAPFSMVAEDFRILGNKVRLICENESIRTILVTSPVPTEGKSTITSNLGIALTRMGLRVVVIDADLHLPRIHKLFGLNQNEGLVSLLNTGHINGALQSTGLDGLKVLSSGGVPSNPAELLSSANLERLLQELKEKTDIVLIDCPPVLTVSDTSILAAKVDGVLLVLRAGYSESAAAREAEEALRQVKAKLIGVVLNSVPTRRKSYYYYGTEPKNARSKK